jgi:hypothetical protein
MQTDIHALSGIGTHDPSVRGPEDSSCLRPRDHPDRLSFFCKSPKFSACSVPRDRKPSESREIVLYLYHAVWGATCFQGCRLNGETHSCNILSKPLFAFPGYSSTLKMEAIRSTETLVKPHQTTRHHVLYDSALQKQAHTKANSCLSCQEIPNPIVHYHVHCLLA